MKHAFSILGLQPGASLAEIKKAYARLLKLTRPDEDAEAFQRLQEAYEHCVAHAKRRAAQAEARERLASLATSEGGPDETGDEELEIDDEYDPAESADPIALPLRSRIQPMALPPSLPQAPPAEASTQTRARPPSLPEEERGRLLAKIVAQAEELGPKRLQEWLHASPDFVSLDAKREISGALPVFLYQQGGKLDTDKLRVLVEFFLGAEYNAIQIDPRWRGLWQRARENDPDAHLRNVEPSKRKSSSGAGSFAFPGAFFLIFLVVKILVGLSSNLGSDADTELHSYPDTSPVVQPVYAEHWSVLAQQAGIYQLPQFQNVDEAFQTLRRVITPQEAIDTPFRAFHVPEGPLAGDWIFSGGNHAQPDYMVHYPLSASYAHTVGQMLCRKDDIHCAKWRESALQVPDLSNARATTAGGRLTFDSPGAAPKSFSCPPLETSMEHASKSVPVAVLFDGSGTVLETALRGTSGNELVDLDVAFTAERCKIEPQGSEPGVLETRMQIQPSR